MKLKFINCLVAVALLGGSAQILTSCKDTNEDEFAQLQDQYLTLQQKHDKDIATLNGLITALQGQLNDLKAELDGYVKKVDFNNYVDEYIRKVSDYQNLKQVLDNLTSVYNEVQDAHGQYNTIGERFAALESALAVAQAQIGDLNNFMNEWKSALGDNVTIQQVVDAVAVANQNKADIEALKQAVAALQQCNCAEKIAELEAKIADIQSKMATQEDLATLAEQLRQEAAENLAKVEQEIADAINAVTGGSDTTIAQLEEMLTGLDIAIVNINNRVQSLEQALDALMGRLDNRITSIEIQGTVNSVFGSLNLPVGIQSNMLVGLVGHNQFPDVQFPSKYTVNTPNGTTVITDSDIATLKRLCPDKFNQITIANGEMLAREINGEVSLGTIYFTANPGNINLEGKTFALENSRGEVSVVKLTNVRPSDKLITLGYSRTAENGLYEADATIVKDDAAINQARFALDDNFRNDVFDILRTPGAGLNGNTIVGLGNALYNQINGILPALGVAASWNENGKDFKVTSHYGVGAVVYQPLSFRFFNGTSFPQIPAIPDLSNYTFDFGNNTIDLTFDQHMAVNSAYVTIDTDLNIIVSVHVEDFSIRVEGYPVISDNGEVIGHTTLNFSSDNIDTIAKDLVAAMKAEIPAGVSAEVKADLTAGINELGANVETQIEENINFVNIAQDMNRTMQDIQNQINDKIESAADRLGNYTGRIQSVLNRLNRVLADPNHYLQPALYYKVGNNFGIMSTSKAIPSQFVLQGGNSCTLVPSTYTLEAVAPAYKKFVAVTNVYQTSDFRHSAKGLDETWQPDAKCVALLKAANAQEHMCEVFSGDRRTVPFLFEGAEGYTYEILYAAIDFQGCASSQKFYVTIK